MAREYLKKAHLTSQSDATDVKEIVQGILADIESGGDEAARKYAAKFDNYAGNIIVTEDEIAAATALVPEKLKADIRFAHDNVRRFAEAQKSTPHGYRTRSGAGACCWSKGDPRGCRRVLCSGRAV